MLTNREQDKATGLEGQGNLSGGNIHFLVGGIGTVVQMRNTVRQGELSSRFLLVVLIDQHDVVTPRLTILHQGNDKASGLRVNGRSISVQ